MSRSEVGHALGEFYGYQVTGLFQSDDDIAKSPVQDGAAPGLFKYTDLDVMTRSMPATEVLLAIQTQSLLMV